MISVPEGMHTFTGRLASFDVAHQPPKRRASAAKSKIPKLLTWPHTNPSPTQLAKAGFFYRPTASNVDNATCFICRKSLDGWEENDNPAREHLHHSPDCGWAINACIEFMTEDEIRSEDPLSERMMKARNSTFLDRWPHDGKRGWTCKTQKMVDAGWYYCPTPESEDFVTCAYCNLSLDGWEPKDNPLDEHHRRSPGCLFFALINQSANASKPARTAKGRPSKASRLSVQSIVTTASEVPSGLDAEAEEGDTISTTATLPSSSMASKGGKKGTKAFKATTGAKGKTTRSKKEEPIEVSEIAEPEDDDFEVKVDVTPVQLKKGKKRGSDEMDHDIIMTLDEEEGNQKPYAMAPPSKRRVTRSRNSVALPQNVSSASAAELESNDANMIDIDIVTPPRPVTKEGGKGGRRSRVVSASSTTRKVSTASTASKASLRAEDTRDDAIEAALEADLNRPLTDDEAELQEMVIDSKPKARRLTKTRPGSKKAAASIASVRRGTRASQAVNEDVAMPPPIEEILSLEAIAPTKVQVEEYQQPSKAKAVKSKGERGASVKQAIEPHPETLTSDSAVNPVTQLPDQSPKVSESHTQLGVSESHQQNTHIASSPSQVIMTATKSQGSVERLPHRATRVSALSNIDSDAIQNSEFDASTLTTRTIEDDSGHETDASRLKSSTAKMGRKTKRASTLKKNKGSKKGGTMKRNIEDIVQKATEVAEIGLALKEDAMVKEDNVSHEEAQTGANGKGMRLSNAVAEDAELDITKPAMSRVVEVEKGAEPIPELKRGKLAGKSTRSKVVKPKAKSKVELVNVPPTKEPDMQDEPIGEGAFTEIEEVPASPSAVKTKASTVKAEQSTQAASRLKANILTIVEPSPPPRETTPSPSPQSSDAENQPPSSRPSASRPPAISPFQQSPARIPLANNTPLTSPSKRNIIAGGLLTNFSWTAVDLETVFLASPSSRNADKENVGLSDTVSGMMGDLTSPEKKMSVEEWIFFNARKGEERLRGECERMVGVFEGEGVKALRALEGIECAE